MESEYANRIWNQEYGIEGNMGIWIRDMNQEYGNPGNMNQEYGIEYGIRICQNMPSDYVNMQWNQNMPILELNNVLKQIY